MFVSELVLIGYPDEDAALGVWRRLVARERGFLIDLEMPRSSAGTFVAMCMSPRQLTTVWPAAP